MGGPNGGARSTETGSGRFADRIDPGRRVEGPDLMAEYEAPKLEIISDVTDLTLGAASA